MCGIGGVWLKGSREAAMDALERMNAAMVHRGPDDGGVEVITLGGGQIGLGNRRLAIQDLSPSGHQPMNDPTTGNWVVFNGEIYNFGQLRGELRALGVEFRSGCDTEVLLQAYAHWGLAATLLRLRGMFAFAIWDARAGQLLLARDRLGVKPLYYAETPDGVAFGSELRALLASRLVPARLSLDGLASYLALGALQDPLTLVEGVRSLPAGSVGVVTAGPLAVRPYWSLLDCFRGEAKTPARPAALAEVRERLRDAVALRLISDAPVGVFLSGGIDSTAVVSQAAASTSDLRTVSVVFAEQEFSEEPYIQEVVNRFHCQHAQVELSDTDLLNLLPHALEAMDQPTLDGINTYVVARQARALGLTVVLSGIGGDELFGGYASFHYVPRLEALARWLPAPVGRAAGNVALRARDDDQTRKLARWLARRDLDDGAMMLARELFGPTDRAMLVPATGGATALQTPSAVDLDAFNEVSYFELGCYLRNVLLRDTDVMGMAHSIEIREPLLDHELLEYVAGLPGSLKRTGAGPKPLLVEALGEALPPRIVQRKKMGFGLPFARWLRQALRQPVAAALLDPEFGGQVAYALDPASVSGVWHRFVDGKGTWVRPWALYALKSWGERHLP